MKVICPDWAKQFPDLVVAFSTVDKSWPEDGNMAFDGSGSTAKNRKKFLKLAGATNPLASVNQVHGANIINVDRDKLPVVADAMISQSSDYTLGLKVADCPAVLVYDPETTSYAAIHSGWRGSSQNIVLNTIDRMHADFGSQPENLLAWISPAIQQTSYEVGSEVAERFDSRHLGASVNDGKFMLDVPGVIHGQLLAAGLLSKNMEKSTIDTSADQRFFSYRKDSTPKRMLALIGPR